MLRFYLTAALALPGPLVAHAAAISVDFCPRANTLLKVEHFAVYGKEVDDTRYVIAIASAHTLERMRSTSPDASLEARRQIVSYVEGRTVGSSESFSVRYRFHGLESYRLNCSGTPVVLFVQDRSKLEKLNQNLQLGNDATQLNKPNPLKSAEENLIDALRNIR
jgi:hypothetical protein